MSIGLQVGLGVGCGVLAIMLGLIIILLCRRRRRVELLSDDYKKNELQVARSSSLLTKEVSPYELQARTPRIYHEAPGWNMEPQELHATL